MVYKQCPYRHHELDYRCEGEEAHKGQHWFTFQEYFDSDAKVDE